MSEVQPATPDAVAPAAPSLAASSQASPAPAPPVDTDVMPALAPTASPIDPSTGEPRRPWLAWAALALFFAGAGVTLVALLWGMWLSVRHFADATWLNRAVPTELGDPFRVVLTVATWAAAVLVGGVASTVGYYAWAGYRWTRWGGLVAVAVGCLSFLGHWLAPWALVPIVLGAAVLWLPPMRRFSTAWSEHRHPAVEYPPLPDAVAYGPLPRYRRAAGAG